MNKDNYNNSLSPLSTHYTTRTNTFFLLQLSVKFFRFVPYINFITKSADSPVIFHKIAHVFHFTSYPDDTFLKTDWILSGIDPTGCRRSTSALILIACCFILTGRLLHIGKPGVSKWCESESGGESSQTERICTELQCRPEYDTHFRTLLIMCSYSHNISLCTLLTGSLTPSIHNA